MSGNEAQQISGNQTYDQLKPKNLTELQFNIRNPLSRNLSRHRALKKKMFTGFFFCTKETQLADIGLTTKLITSIWEEAYKVMCLSKDHWAH